MHKLLFLTVCTLVLMSPAVRADDDSKVWIHGGYAYLNEQQLGLDMHGWSGGVTYWVNDFIGVGGDFSGSYGSDVQYYNILFGVTLASRRNEKYIPFTHFLLGVGQAQQDWLLGGQELGTSTAEFAFALGGGVDLRLNDRIALRLFQTDYIRQTGDLDSNQFRLTTGIVFRLGD